MQRKELDKVCDKNKTCQILWDAAKAVLRGKFIEENAYIREEISKIDNHAFYLKKLQREKQTKPKANRKKVLIKSKNH